MEIYTQKTPKEVKVIQFTGTEDNIKELKNLFNAKIIKEDNKYYLDTGCLKHIHIYDYIVKEFNNSIHAYSPYIMYLLYKKK